MDAMKKHLVLGFKDPDFDHAVSSIELQIDTFTRDPHMKWRLAGSVSHSCYLVGVIPMHTMVATLVRD